MTPEANAKRAAQAILNRKRGKAEEDACKGFLLKICRAMVWQTGPTGAASNRKGFRGGMREPGMFDFWVTIPEHGLAFWWDVKAGGARLSPVQRAFYNDCMTAGIPIGYGDLETLKHFLEDRGVIATEGPRVLYRTKRQRRA